MRLNIYIARYERGVVKSTEVTTIEANFVADIMEGPGSVSRIYQFSYNCQISEIQAPRLSSTMGIPCSATFLKD